MPVSDAQRKAIAKYDAKKYEYCTVKVKKGTKELIRDFAAARGESVNGFITRAIAETMEREKDDADK